MKVSNIAICAIGAGLLVAMFMRSPCGAWELVAVIVGAAVGAVIGGFSILGGDNQDDKNS